MRRLKYILLCVAIVCGEFATAQETESTNSRSTIYIINGKYDPYFSTTIANMSNYTRIEPTSKIIAKAKISASDVSASDIVCYKTTSNIKFAKEGKVASYSGTAKLSNGKSLGGSPLLVEVGKTDKDGVIMITAHQGDRLMITCNGFKNTRSKLGYCTQQTITARRQGEAKRSNNNDKEQVRRPIYIVNKRHIPAFNAKQYKDDIISQYETFDWRKVEEALRYTTITRSDVEKNGVIFLTLPDSYKFLNEGVKGDYALKITDTAGNAIEGATVYVSKCTTDRNGVFSLKAVCGSNAVIYDRNGKHSTFFKLPCVTDLLLEVEATKRKKGALFINADGHAINLANAPSFNGKPGINAFRIYVMKQLRYPKQMQKGQITGEVRVSFVVGRQGEITNVKILHSTHPAFQKEVIRIFKEAPAWQPGSDQSNITHPIRFYLPIHFGTN